VKFSSEDSLLHQSLVLMVSYKLVAIHSYGRHDFLQGCRPYIAMDVTHLTGRSRGQSVDDVVVDGYN
jgi:hypothetical protein